MMMEIRAVTRGALTIALVFILFSVFRGVSNILNALFIPLTIYTMTMAWRIRERLSVMGLLVLLTLLFFQVQIFFVLLYCILAALLPLWSDRNYSSFRGGFILSPLIALGFGISVFLTDLVFLTNIGQITLRFLGGNFFLYAAILWVEALLVGSALYGLTQVVRRKVRGFNQN